MNKFEQDWKKLDVNYVVDKPNGPCPIVSKLHETFTSKLEQNVDPTQFFLIKQKMSETDILRQRLDNTDHISQLVQS